MLISWASQQQAFKPAVQLDFTTGALDPRITFTRTSAATYVNSAGNVVSASANVARFDYDPATLAPKGLLIESQRTNLLLRSEEFDNASWTKANVTVTANAVTAPDGTTTADKVQATATAATVLSQLVASVSGTSATYSIYAKQGSGPTDANIFLLRNNTTATNLISGTLNYSTGVWTYTTGSTGVTVSNAGNGWWRIQITVTSGITSGDGLLVYAGFMGNSEAAGEFAYLWGAQLEAGSFATSYIPTVASQVTRAADQASIVAPNFAPWYNQSEGTFVVEAVTQKPTSLVATVIAIDASDGGINNRHYIGVVSASAEVRTVNGGSVQSLLTQAYTANVIEKYAYAVKANDFAFARNGNIVGTDTSGSMPTIDRMFIGNAAGSAAYFNGHIRSIRYFPTRLSNAQLQALSA